MNVPPGLVTGLRALVHGDPDDTELLHRRLEELAIVLRSAVPSLLGFTVIVRVDGGPVRLDLVEPVGDPSGSTLAVGLDALTGTAGSELIVYAGTPGSLVDLAADLAYVLPSAGAALDAHLDTRPLVSGITGAGEVSRTNVAVGIMIEQGWLPHEALTALTRRAVTLGVPVPEAAAEVIAEARRQFPRTAPEQPPSTRVTTNPAAGTSRGHEGR